MESRQDNIINDILWTIESISRYNTHNVTSEKINIENVESMDLLKGEIKERIKNLIEYPAPRQGLAGQMQAIEGHDTYERLPEIKAPTLIIHGDADKVNPVENARILASRIPDTGLVILKNMKHMFMLEAQDETTQIVMDFLKRHSER